MSINAKRSPIHGNLGPTTKNRGNTDMEADASANTALPDTRGCTRLAALIRDNLDALARECRLRYLQDYPHSMNGGLSFDASCQWSRTNLLSVAAQLEQGRIDPDEYAHLRGDIVLQHEETAYPIEAFIEECLFMARIVADLVWRSCIGDAESSKRLLAALESFTQTRIRANMDAYANRLSRPGTIAQTWQLGRRWEDERNKRGETTGPGPRPNTIPASSPITPSWEETLTPREKDIVALVTQGLSNRQTASRLGLQESTVRNALSRAYAKLGVASRAELILLANRTET